MDDDECPESRNDMGTHSDSFYYGNANAPGASCDWCGEGNPDG